MTLVVDASVAVKWAVSESGSDAAARILSRPLIAPDLFLAEFGNALTKKVRRNEIALEQAWQALEEVGDQVKTLPTSALLAPAFELSVALRHSIYDCYYLALADALQRPFVTADTVFVAKVRGGGLGSLIYLLGENIGDD